MESNKTNISVHPSAANRFDELGIEVLGKLQAAAPEVPKVTVFKPDIYTVANITGADIIGTPKMRQEIVNGLGEITGISIQVRGGLKYSLLGENYSQLKKLAESIASAGALKGKVSLEFVLDALQSWLESSASEGIKQGLSSFIIDRANAAVTSREIWIPLHLVYVQTPIKIGLVTFQTIGREMMDRWQERWSENAGSREPNVRELHNRLRSRIQGCFCGCRQRRGRNKGGAQNGNGRSHCCFSTVALSFSRQPDAEAPILLTSPRNGTDR